MPKRAERLARNPRGWPLRWRLAAVSAGLTMAILVVFAVIIGRLAQDRIQDDFNEELRYSAGQIATQIEIESATGGALQLHGADLEQMAMADAAVIRILGPGGEVEVGPGGNPPLGPPEPGIVEAGNLAVATAPVITSAIGEPQRFVQYARDTEELDATISRLWFFLATGVIAGTALAALAGFVVAGRAMRPISDLTASAREIAATRDPSRRMPQPDTGDEVAELAKTLEEMLEGLEASRAEREQMMQAQRDFVADASHELRTPLTSILANLELLEASLERQRDTLEDDEDAATVNSALRSSKRMSRLVSDLLLLARADAGRTAPRRDCNLAELAANAAEELRPLAGDREIDLRAPGEVVVTGNPDELHRMISNLLDNAVRHTPDGSRIEIRAEAAGERARLVVSDDGPGLPEGLGQQVFERFVRGSGPADRDPGGGTGLGLAIVRAVATSHGGSVIAGTSDAGGARFEIDLPLGESLAAEAGRVGTHG
ncbi:MAG TPA: HAMP domain-containing sensor histidine kinase [Solirubrobacterales bacterium]